MNFLLVFLVGFLMVIIGYLLKHISDMTKEKMTILRQIDLLKEKSIEPVETAPPGVPTDDTRR